MNKSIHTAVGSISAASIYLIMKKSLNEEPSIEGLLFFITVGGLVGALPDQLEPATSPQHRAFFHSTALLCAGGYLLYRYYLIKDIDNKSIRIAISALCAAYGSHLVLDSFTPMGLPIC